MLIFAPIFLMPVAFAQEGSEEMRLRRPADGRLLGFRGIAASGDVTDPDGGVSASWNHVNGEIEVKVKIGQCLTKFWSGWLPNIYD